MTHVDVEVIKARQAFSEKRLDSLEAAIEKRLDKQDAQLDNLDEKLDKLLLEVASAHAETKRSLPPPGRTAIDAKTTAGITAAVSGTLLAVAEIIKAVLHQ